MTTLILQLGYAASFATMLLADVSPAVAQRTSVSIVPSVPATAVLTNFEKMTSEGKAVIPKEVQYPQRYSAARVDSVLDGLERIAQASNMARRFPTSAPVLAIMEAGSAEQPPAGIFEREMRLYRASNSVTVRNAIIVLMPRQKDRTRALAFLKSVAMQSGQQRDYEYAPYQAAQALSHMGKDGRAALIDLRDKKLLRDGKAIGFVNWFLSTK